MHRPDLLTSPIVAISTVNSFVIDCLKYLASPIAYTDKVYCMYHVQSRLTITLAITAPQASSTIVIIAAVNTMVSNCLRKLASRGLGG